MIIIHIMFRTCFIKWNYFRNF